ncbi:hypothetical protein ABZ408_19350 [Streptomyces tibetensis]|jgi:hypothetical protein|uniref:Lipoprotein n=1 Tax=Streptomyces tibetensis TaxID=2382123 RepID=A0ABW6N4W7_9ACTN
MALLGNPVMMHGLRNSRRDAILLASILSAALVTGCSSDHKDIGSKDPKPSTTPPSATSDQTKVLEKKVEEVLRVTHVDDTNGLFVESGLERVSDGVHTRSALANGKSYTLVVVCAGVGKVRLAVTTKPPVRQTVECNSVPVRQRITDAPAQLLTDVEGLAGATGVIGWRIDELAK